MLLKLLKREASWFTKNIRSSNPLDLPRVQRASGTWNHADLEWIANKARDVPGDFAEIGVFRGAAFRKVAALAAQQGKRAHAFDSFIGMDAPTSVDGPSYPKGMFDIGGPDAFVQLMSAVGVERTLYDVWPGYVPECFTPVPESIRFSWAILDLDHYQPTVDGLRWLPARINDGGILALDDYVAQNKGKLATRAIDEFLASNREFEKIALVNQQMILRKKRRA